MNVLHFSGEGRGFMSGISEYVVVVDDDEIDVDEQCAPGFELVSNTELIIDLPASFPTNENLIIRR